MQLYLNKLDMLKSSSEVSVFDKEVEWNLAKRLLVIGSVLIASTSPKSWMCMD